MKNKLGLHPISIEYLKGNMLAESNVYRYMDQKPVLMFKEGAIIDEEALTRVKQGDATLRNIYVQDGFYHTLQSHAVPNSLNQAHLERKIGYDGVKDQSREMLQEIERSGVVSSSRAQRITMDVMDKLDTVSVALILQCINGNNGTDEYLYTHSTNVSFLNGIMAKWLGSTEEESQRLISCGLLHDVGKTRISKDILHAPRPLTKEEFESMKRHPEYSYEILQASPGVHPEVALGAYYHHEKMNGRGYPKALIAEDIPFLSRVTAVSDVYDAMVSKRAYKEACSPFSILEQLAEGKFSDLDYKLTQIFLENIPRELVGKTVRLSDGAIGVVRFVDARHWQQPVVDVDGEVFACSEDRYCVSMAFDTI